MKRRRLIVVSVLFGGALGTFAQTSPQAPAKKTVRQAPPKADQSEIDKALADLADLLKKKLVLDKSDQEIARSNQLQTATTELLDRRQDKIVHEDVPALNERGEKHNAGRRRIIASGCPGKGETLPRDVALRCRPLEDAWNREEDELEADAQSLKDQAAAIQNDRAAVSVTTLANAQKQKANNAERDDLLAKKKQLEATLLDLKNKIVSCTTILHRRGVTCEKIKLQCGMVQFDGSDPDLPPSTHDSPCP
jgi:hypothetical protein